MTEPIPLSRALYLAEPRTVLRGVSWETYYRLLEETGDNRRVLMAYNRGVLEFMSPGMTHEDYKGRFDRLVEVVSEELRLPCKSYGSTTWRRD